MKNLKNNFFAACDMTRLDNVKRLFSTGTPFDPIVNDTYQKRVQENDELISSLSIQAKQQIEILKTDYAQFMQLQLAPDFDINVKREIVAKYRTYQKILYNSSKSDVISESTTNTLLNKMVVDQVKMERDLEKWHRQVKDELASSQLISDTYRDISVDLKGVIDGKKQQSLDLDTLQLLVVGGTSQRALLERIIEMYSDETGELMNELDKCLRVVLEKYLDFSGILANSSSLVAFVKMLIQHSLTGKGLKYDDLGDIDRELVNALSMTGVVDVGDTVKLRDMS